MLNAVVSTGSTTINFMKIPHILSIIFIFLLWQISAMIVDSPLILPLPKEVFLCILKLFREIAFWKNVFFTFLRVIESFLFSIIFGTIFGILCGKFAFAKDFLEIPISILRSTPVVALILILIFAFSSSTVPIVVSILMSLPVMISTISNGFLLSEDDKKLFQMAKIFRFTKKQRILHLWIPKLRPFFLASFISSFGMSWKVVVAGEVLCLPRFALGTQLSTAQVHLESQEVLAISIIIVFFSFLLERFLKKIFSKVK